jgi:hypothetical protein
MIRPRHFVIWWPRQHSYAGVLGSWGNGQALDMARFKLGGMTRRKARTGSLRCAGAVVQPDATSECGS